MSAKYKSPSFLLPNEKNTSLNPSLSADKTSMYSMDFNGTDYIDIPITSSLQITNNFTYSFWIKTSGGAGSNSEGTFISNQFSWQTSGYTIGTYSNKIQVFGSDGTSVYFNASTMRGIGDNNITDNQWHHIAVTFASGVTKVYIDGSLPTNGSGEFTSGATSISYNNTTIFRIGQSATGGNYGHIGQIDEVAVFNRVLNTTEIAALYEGTSPNIYPSNLIATNLNPVAYYPLGEQAQNSGYPSATGNEWQFPNGVLQDYVFDFNGTDYIDSLYTGLNGSSQTTISFWLNTSNINQNAHFFGNRIGSTGFSAQFFTDGNTYVYLNGQSFTFNTSTYFSNNTWHNFVIVFNGSLAAGNRLKAYVDNTLITFSSVSSTTISASTSNLLIGYSPTGGYFNGKLSNFVLWNSDQSANIANIYNNGSPQTSYTVAPQNWWKLNADSVYTPSAPNYTTALDFDGTSNYISVPSSLPPSGTSNFAISGWFYRDSTSSTASVYFDKVQGTNFLVREAGASGTIEIFANGTNYNYSSLSTYNTANAWHHIVISYDGSNLTVYVDTNKLSQSATGLNISSTSDMRIGARSNNNNLFKGFISNVAVYNTNLTDANVSTLFNFGTPETAISFSPQAWWKLDNTTTGIQDSSDNGNNGTNNGATQVNTSVAVVPSWKIPTALPITTPNYTKAIDFPRSNSNYINTSFNPSTVIGDNASFTISSWVRPTDVNNFMIFMGSYSSSNNRRFFLGVNSSAGNIEYGYGSKNLTLSANINVNIWQNIILVYDNSAGYFYGYVNGQLIDSYNFTDPAVISSANIRIGTAANLTLPYGGDVSNLAIYDSALSQSNVSTIYNNGTPQTTIFGSPVAWWKLDNITTITDSSSSGYTGTIVGSISESTTDVLAPQPVNGVSTTLPSTALQQSDLQFDSPYSNYSLSFDGTGGYIDCGNDSSLNISGDLTLSAWINVNDLSSFRSIISKRDSTVGYEMVVRTSGEISFYTDSGQNSKSTATVSLNTWTNIIITVESGVTNGTKIYFNGVADTWQSGGTHTIVANTNTLSIGRRYGTTWYFNGNIDETSIFNYALSSAQILEIYNNGRPKDLGTFSGTAPISWWRLGENAYFDNNTFTVPNSIIGAPNGTGAGTVTSMLTADAPGTYANGVGTNLDIIDRVGDAVLSTANSQSYNMIPSDISPYVPQYVGKQIANNFSMTFDGTNYFDIGSSLNSTINGFTNNFSVSCWIKADAGSGNVRRGIIGNYDQTKGFYIDLISSSANAFTIRTGYHSSATAYNVRDNTTTLVANGNTWYNIVATVSGNASGNVLVYVNGVLENGTVYFSTPTSYSVTTNLEIAHVAHGSNRFSGQIDEVAIFDTALNAGQIYNDLYQPTATGANQTADLVNNPNLPNPVAWYRMGD